MLHCPNLALIVGALGNKIFFRGCMAVVLTLLLHFSSHCVFILILWCSFSGVTLNAGENISITEFIMGKNPNKIYCLISLVYILRN